MNNTTMPIAQQREHLPWVDVARITAIFLVICCHCCDPFNCSPQARTNLLFQYWGSLYGSFFRPCVPLFAMMTGLLILPVRGMSIKQFYRKRIMRVLTPMLIWSVLYNLFPWFVGVIGGDKADIITFFPYSGFMGAEPSLDIVSALKNIALIPFTFSVYAVHMWYLYMLIGLYLFMPILSSWMEKTTRGDLKVFLILWGVSLFFPYVYQYISTYFWGTCSWNAFGMLYYFAGFNGYLILGYYLKNYNKMGWGKTLMIAIPIFAVSYVVTLLGFRSMTGNPNATEEMIELFWTYCSPNVALLTIACFIILQKINITSDVWRKKLSVISKYGFGIYMCHYFFVGIGYHIIDLLGVPVPIQIPVAAILVFICSWLFTWAVFYSLPKAAKWIMG